MARNYGPKRGPSRYCSKECCAAHFVTTGVFRGSNNPRWLGGVSNDNMRYRRRQKERHPLEEAARKAVANAIRAGKLTRQPCEKCGAEIAQAHHDDYEQPLVVRWLCRLHHDEHHREERLAKRRARVRRIEAKRPDDVEVKIEIGERGAEALSESFGTLAADLWLDGKWKP
jgi:hypothetical protein